jgi:hypothetical protein
MKPVEGEPIELPGETPEPEEASVQDMEASPVQEEREPEVVDGDVVQEVEVAPPVDVVEAPAASQEARAEEPEAAPRGSRRKRAAKPASSAKGQRDKKPARPRTPRKKTPVPVGA